MQKVFGIGWAKTGTKTLGACFKQLGYKHQSRRLDLVLDISKGDITKAISLAQKKESFEDWPWIILYKELDRYFPNSKFILTIREKNNWIRSYRNLLVSEGKPTKKILEIRRFLYELPFPQVTDEQLINRYMRHNKEVNQYFKYRQNQLLIVDWEKGHGWKELCDFLGVNIPKKDFPHANRGKYI
jgi:hypothetical protein